VAHVGRRLAAAADDVLRFDLPDMSLQRNAHGHAEPDGRRESLLRTGFRYGIHRGCGPGHNLATADSLCAGHNRPAGGPPVVPQLALQLATF
jgi:hypothetical protein